MDTTNINTNTNIHFFLEDLTEDKLEDNENMLQQLLKEFENQELNMNLEMDMNMNMGGNNGDIDDLGYFVKKQLYTGKKSDIISTIIYFENSAENIEIVNNRHKMWAYMTELINDSKMKQYLLW